MRIVVQNLQKRRRLASDVIEEYRPDVLVAQEINLRSEAGVLVHDPDRTATFVSRLGHGTAIIVQENSGGVIADGDDGSNNDGAGIRTMLLRNVRNVESPHAELGGWIRKKTTLATITSATEAAAESSGDVDASAEGHRRGIVDVVSFHGYNGQPFCDCQKLVDHVRVVAEALQGDNDDEHDDGDPFPVVWAGDFNTWSTAHVDAVCAEMAKHGFILARSWAYPGRDVPLDHVFIRGPVEIVNFQTFSNHSDHLGAIMEVRLLVKRARK